MSLIDWLRIYTVSVATLVSIFGSFQWRRFPTYKPENQLAWLSVAGFNLAVGLGTLEALLEHAPGGFRSYATAVSVTWALSAVCYHPYQSLKEWRSRRTKEIR